MNGTGESPASRMDMLAKKHVRVHVWIQHRLQYMIIDYIVNIIIYYYSYYSYLFLIPHMGRWPNPTIECFCFFWDVMGWNMLKPRLEGSPLADVEHRRACLAKQTCYQNQWNRCWISRKLEESSLSMTLWYPMHVGVSRICCSVLLLCLGFMDKDAMIIREKGEPWPCDAPCDPPCDGWAHCDVTSAFSWKGHDMSQCLYSCLVCFTMVSFACWRQLVGLGELKLDSVIPGIDPMLRPNMAKLYQSNKKTSFSTWT
jgi:hypothetical protein